VPTSPRSDDVVPSHPYRPPAAQAFRQGTPRAPYAPFSATLSRPRPSSGADPCRCIPNLDPGRRPASRTHRAPISQLPRPAKPLSPPCHEGSGSLDFRTSGIAQQGSAYRRTSREQSYPHNGSVKRDRALGSTGIHRFFACRRAPRRTMTIAASAVLVTRRLGPDNAQAVSGVGSAGRAEPAPGAPTPSSVSAPASRARSTPPRCQEATDETMRAELAWSS